MVDLHPFAEKVLCTDVDFGYDGKMVISDWGEGWTGNEEGRLYSVWDEAHVAEGDVSEIFANGFIDLPVDTLIQMLSHVDRRVRIRAQYELANRKSAVELVEVLQSKNQLSRIHAMWALAMIDRSGLKSVENIVPLLDDRDPEIRVQACQILGEANYTKAFAKIVEMIDDPNARVSYFATMATGYLGSAKDSIIEMLERNNNEDVYLRHAGVVALSKTQYAATMANLQTHPSQAVRLAAVLVLRRMESVFVTDYLNDPDDVVATEAARAIHDARIDGRGFGDEEGARQTLAASLSKARTIPWQKRAISANKMEHDCEGSVRVAEFAADETKPYEMRLLAMQALNNWGPPHHSKADRDIVEGRDIPRQHRIFVCIEGVDDAITKLLTESEGELLMETLRFASSNNRLFPKELCSKFVLDEKMPVSIRAYALQENASKELIEYALQSKHWKLRSTARDILLSQNDLSSEKLLLEAIQVGEIFEAQEAIKSLTRRPISFSKIDQETLRDELQLDYAEPWNKEIEDEWLLSGGNGIIGKQIVFENSQSECLRCHKIEGKGGIAGPPLDGVANRLDENQLLASLLYPNENVAEGFGDYSAMPPMGVLLSKREIRDVIEYLKTLQE
jgi:HEAT repeat protein